MGQIIRPLLTPRRRQSLSPAVYCCVIVCVQQGTLSYEAGPEIATDTHVFRRDIGRLLPPREPSTSHQLHIGGQYRRWKRQGMPDGRYYWLKHIPKRRRMKTSRPFVGGNSDVLPTLWSGFDRSFTSSPCGGWNRSVYNAGWRGWVVYSSKTIAERVAWLW